MLSILLLHLIKLDQVLAFCHSIFCNGLPLIFAQGQLAISLQHVALASLFLLNVDCFFQLGCQVFLALSKLLDFFDEFDVLTHDILVVLLVDQVLLLEALLKSLMRLLQVLFLVYEFAADVLIDLRLLCALTFTIGFQLLHSLSQILWLIDVLDDLIDSWLEVLYVDFVLTYPYSRRFNQL